MWKQFLEIFTNVVTYAQRVSKLEQKVKSQEQSLKDLATFSQWLAFELQRVKDEQKHSIEHETDARKLFELRVENQLLKSGRQLPPANDQEKQ